MPKSEYRYWHGINASDVFSLLQIQKVQILLLVGIYSLFHTSDRLGNVATLQRFMLKVHAFFTASQLGELVLRGRVVILLQSRLVCFL